jgi:hypothetical protein
MSASILGDGDIWRNIPQILCPGVRDNKSTVMHIKITCRSMPYHLLKKSVLTGLG